LAANGSDQKAVRQKPTTATAARYPSERHRGVTSRSPGMMHTSTTVVTMCDSTRAMRMRQLSTKNMLKCGFSIPRYMVPRNRKTKAKLNM
jgi:hypothetical protein